jgi:hypothetical protein
MLLWLRIIVAGVGEQQADELGSNPAPWSAKEQKLLEQAMRTFGADVPDRWDKIAEMITTRTKKDCMKRYKVRVASMLIYSCVENELFCITSCACVLIKLQSDWLQELCDMVRAKKLAQATAGGK